MSWPDKLSRRDFLSGIWKWGTGLVAVAAAWTTWDLLRPATPVGFGGQVRTVSSDTVPGDGIVYAAGARAYLTKVDDEVIALSETCPHLKCRVPWCDDASEFECPCHGSFFNRVGEYRTGPSPRGMDRFQVEIVDGMVVVDTGAVIEGPPPGPESINEPPTGKSCAEADHG